MTDPAHNLAAVKEARIWADLHGHQRPDDRMLAAYGQVLLEEVRTALAGTLRRIATGHHDLGVAQTPAEAYARAADLVDSVLQPTGDEVDMRPCPWCVTPPGHHYLSTGCRQDEHAYCTACKFCAAPCRCSCHLTMAAEVTR